MFLKRTNLNDYSKEDTKLSKSSDSFRSLSYSLFIRKRVLRA